MVSFGISRWTKKCSTQKTIQSDLRRDISMLLWSGHIIECQCRGSNSANRIDIVLCLFRRVFWRKKVLFHGLQIIMWHSLLNKLHIIRRVRYLCDRKHQWNDSAFSRFILCGMSSQTYSNRWLSLDEIEISRFISCSAYDRWCYINITRSWWTLCNDISQCLWPVNVHPTVFDVFFILKEF